MSSDVIKPVLLFTLTLLFAGLPASSQTIAEHQRAHVKNIENDTVEVSMSASEPAQQMSLQELLDVYKVPGFSIAVIDDYKIVWAKAYGVTDVGSHNPVTTTTLFQAGSVSKPVAAVGTLWLVEHGKLSLDQNVNEKLKTWKVPENEFTTTQKVTLRRLMSHTAGLTVHGFPGYDVDDPMPTLVQIFNGEKPANTEPIRVNIVPGTTERYSGGGITIEQQLFAASSARLGQPHRRGHAQRWNDSSWALAHLPRNGSRGIMDDSNRPRQIRHRNRPLQTRQGQPCSVGVHHQ